jgi:hypothetical protein
MSDIVLELGDPVPVPGSCEELDLSCRPTGKVFQFRNGASLPRQPRHRSWRLI